MTLGEMQEKLRLRSVAGIPSADKKIEGCYASDMLSWVMAHAKENQVWITIQSHQNIVAVASLLNLAAIIVAEGITIDENTLSKAKREGIPIYSSDLSIFQLCGILYYLMQVRIHE